MIIGGSSALLRLYPIVLHLVGKGFFHVIGPCPEPDRRSRHEECLEGIWVFQWSEG